MLRLNAASCVLLQIFMILPIIGTGGGSVKEPRIIDGVAAQSDAVKHQVSIRYREEDSIKFGDGHFCGGSLISNNVVMTAAHCFVGSNFKYMPDKEFVLVMGNLNRFELNNNTLRFDILKTIKGPFDIEFKGDIALVILNGTVPDSHPTVQPIRLSDAPLQHNTLCQVTGWGLTEEHQLSSFLRTADVPIIDCSSTEYLIREGMLCAGYLEGGRDACSADSGGPLVCDGVQAGIVSWGNGCGAPLNPGVYTDVAYYQSWISEQLTNYNTSLPQFGPEPPTEPGTDAATEAVTEPATKTNATARLRLSLFLLSVLLTTNLIS